MHTEACARCGDPVDLTQPHHTLNANIECMNHRGTVVTVIESETIEYRHLTCGPTAIPAAP